MADRVMYLRFVVGRWLIHAGLKAMPHGRVRRELHRTLEQWSDGVRKKLTTLNTENEDRR